MSDLFRNHIVGFPTRRLIYYKLKIRLVSDCILFLDAAKQNEEWDASGTVDPNLEIPLLMQNKVPEGYETDDKLDVSLRPDEVWLERLFIR